MIIDGTNIWLYFRRQYVLKYYIQLFDKQVVQLKPHEFGEVLSKLEQFFPSQNLFWKVKFAIKSIYLAGDIEGFFCPDYTNVVTLFMHEQQKKLDLSLSTDC